MYKPVGLGCGHKFCKLCVLRSARITTFNKPFRELLCARCKCPMCRQDGVISAAVEMVSLNNLIRKRFTSQVRVKLLVHLKRVGLPGNE